MNKTILASTLCLFTLLVVTTYGVTQRSELKDTTESRYKIGQVWTYWTRSNEKKSSFVVVKIEKHPTLKNIIHIALRGLKIRKPNGNFIGTIGHLALTESAVDGSGAKLLTEKAHLPDYKEGYRLWREAFDAGRGGAYTVSIAQAVEEIEANLNRGVVPAGAKREDKLLSGHQPLIYQAYHPAMNTTQVTAILGSDSEMPGLAMIFPEKLGVITPYQAGLLLGAAHYYYKGTTPSGARSGRFTFVTKRKEFYQDPPAFTISVEGQSVHDGEAELYQISYQVDGSNMAVQWVMLKVPIDVFLRVVGAKNVEFKIGGKTYKPEGFQQKYMRTLAKIIESQSK
jgi:hypothetical protein